MPRYSPAPPPIPLGSLKHIGLGVSVPFTWNFLSLDAGSLFPECSPCRPSRKITLHRLSQSCYLFIGCTSVPKLEGKLPRWDSVLFTPLSPVPGIVGSDCKAEKAKTGRGFDPQEGRACSCFTGIALHWPAVEQQLSNSPVSVLPAGATL